MTNYNDDRPAAIHFIGRLESPICGVTSAFVQMNGHLISVFGRDTTCIACNRELKKLADMGFVPERG
jgi:hypothetical protein